MPPTPPADAARRAQIQAELRRDIAQRQQGYRARALAILPHVCSCCGRSFDGPRLRELTVHHKDHDHTHNPPDGSNWDLLCLYCHDHEHEKFKLAGHFEGARRSEERLAPSIFAPFAQLDGLLNAPAEKPADDAGRNTL
jgi:hypothetical protein